MTATELHVRPPAAGFDHQALFYAGADAFLDGSLPFIRDALADREPILVAVGAPKIERLRRELGADADLVQFADMAELGGNPARIIPAWHEFVAEHARPGRGLRGIGEPIWAERSAAELVECQRHESLLNLAFADAEGFALLCPYDTEALGADVLAEAQCSHPTVLERGTALSSPDCRALDDVAAPFSAELPAPSGPVTALEFVAPDLASVRRFVFARGREAGLSAPRADDLVLAVNEVATNSLRHGGERGELRVWSEDASLICQVSDAGLIEDPLVGRVRPLDDQIGGWGLWLSNQLCDLVQIRSYASGSVVRLHMRQG